MDLISKMILDDHSTIDQIWKVAPVFLDQLNNSNEDWLPQFSFDCNFKLDFDGALLNVSSRFRRYYHEETNKFGWSGNVGIYNFDDEYENKIIDKEFDAPDIDSLNEQLTDYFNRMKAKLQPVIAEALKDFK